MGSSNDEQEKFKRYSGHAHDWKPFSRDFRSLLRRKYFDLSKALFPVSEKPGNSEGNETGGEETES